MEELTVANDVDEKEVLFEGMDYTFAGSVLGS